MIKRFCQIRLKIRMDVEVIIMNKYSKYLKATQLAWTVKYTDFISIEV